MRAASLTLLVGASALALTLTGCVDPGTAPTLPESPTPVVDTPNPTPTVEPTTGAMPLEIVCAELVDPEAVYAVNPNLALLDSWSPEPGSAGEIALAAGGVTCHWVMESGGATMDVSAAYLSPEQTAELEAEAATGEPVDLGERAYFQVVDGVGVTTAFGPEAVVVVASELFADPAESAGIVESALAAIP